jgi:dienelactone hydrolase
MLAELGFDAFALDVYGAGNRPDTNEGRAAATQAAFADPERLAAMIRGSIETARGLSDSEDVVLTGYCFGGTVTLAAARNGMAEGVAGYASFHGNFPEGPDWSADTAPDPDPARRRRQQSRHGQGLDLRRRSRRSRPHL